MCVCVDVAARVYLLFLSSSPLVHDGKPWQAAPVPGERLVGWIAHYAIGVAFAGALIAVCGVDWVREPTLMPAIAAGLISVAAPFFIMQPGLGLGIAAAKTPSPNVARLRSVMAHGVFGLGLFVTAKLVALFF